ncbi:MAG: ImmA/IrrE family metallo-endopeptidase [Parvibaculum sp.]|nr:ImmA/IrrE family metallo-endopeptidase [Parvibaculum sp.]
MVLRLDRIAIEEEAEAAGGDTQRMAEAILNQVTLDFRPIAIREIASALDILEIREEPLASLEGALITTPGKGSGAVLLNTNSAPQRRKYTLAHELCHFLHPWHRPTSSRGFDCSSGDMREQGNSTQHAIQEAQANRFAIELLAPRRLIGSYLRDVPDFEAVRFMHARFDISKAAAARRYAELHDEDLTVVFSRHGVIDYAVKPPSPPNSALWRGRTLPVQIEQRPGQASPWIDADPTDWNLSPGRSVRVQTLQQNGGYAMTLVHAQSGR